MKQNRISRERSTHILTLTWEKLALKIFLHGIVVKKAVYQTAQRMIVHVEKTKNASLFYTTASHAN